MRLLVISQHFWPESFRINTFVDALEGAGAQVTVLTGQPNYPGGVVFPGYRALSIKRERFGVATDVFRVPLVPRARANAIRLAANYVSFVVTASLLGPWLLRGRRFDAILVYAPSPIVQAIPGMVLKRIKGAKLVTWVQDLWPQSLEVTGYVKNKSLLSIAEKVVRWIYRGNDRLMGQSRAFVTAIRPMAGATPVEYFPNPGEVVSTTTVADGPAALVLPSGFNIVFTGNLGTVQALETILGAASLLADDRDVRFVLVGSGSRSPWLVEEVARRGLANVILPGRFEPQAIGGILAQAAALLVTLNKSETLSQTIPSKIQSYLAAGRPILAALDGEGASLVTMAGAGLASPAEDEKTLADNVRRLKQLSAEERTEMGDAGRKYYDLHFQPRVLAEQLLARLRDLVGHDSTSHSDVPAQ
jgi:glycosyltransferase involved in cell wall biosynthesis